MTLEYFIKNFSWKPDKKIDSWRILDFNKGEYSGDCEDFALTVCYILSGQSLVRFWWNFLTFKHILWYTRVGKEGHVMLWVRNRGWIDNLNRDWSKKHPWPKIFPYLVPTIAIKMLFSR